jgi:ubiquinone/menaquinone biosynthesis C-methylase UbiE
VAKTYRKSNKNADQARSNAQKLAFAPIMFQAARALRDFGILDYLKEHTDGVTVGEIADNTGISFYGATVLLEAGLSMDLVMVKEDLYFLTKTGHFLCTDEMIRISMDFVNDVNYRGIYHLQESIRSGKPIGLKDEYDVQGTVYEALSGLPESFRKSWFGYDHFYSDAAYHQVIPIIFENHPRRILDIGGNTGKFAIQCAEYDSNIIVTILDLPGQLKQAEKNITQSGFNDRIVCHSMDILHSNQSLPNGNDIIWMSQFLDCFSEEQIIKILKKVSKSMDQSTSLFILETLWDRQKHEASTYSLHATSLYFTCIANGNSRMYHSEDLQKLIKLSGLKIETWQDYIGISHTLIGCKKI